LGQTDDSSDIRLIDQQSELGGSLSSVGMATNRAQLARSARQEEIWWWIYILCALTCVENTGLHLSSAKFLPWE